MPDLQWHIQPTSDLPDDFVAAVRQSAVGSGFYLAQLLWQRGIRDRDHIPGLLNPALYQPSSPFEFGEEMHRAMERLQQAWQQREQVAIWGDFDADGITATAVLWDGLKQFFNADRQLTYFIPNRLTESHGLSIAGIDALREQGYSLIVTCDTGSTNLEEIEYAQQQGLDLIITDHHTLPIDRPAVTAIINPRSLPTAHPLAHLSGVAVAYKLVEALYETLPQVPTRPLKELLDLVAIGLIADLVQLKGDCRYLAQQGIEQLQQNQLGRNQPGKNQPGKNQPNPTTQPPRPGIAHLLELCKRTGDRPTDISFGLGPRINAISRIYGDARFCVELLTSQEVDRCRQLAEETELANTRRKALQRDVAQQATAQLADLDLSTSSVIVLMNPQWSVGILGLVAGQLAQTYGRPTILLTEDASLLRGSARSVNGIDLYELVQDQAHLLHRYGGHPLAMGLSLPPENLSLFTEAINQRLRERQNQTGQTAGAIVHADLTVTVAALGKELFRELKWLEPYGMGNPVPKLLIRNCWFARGWNANIKDWKGGKVRYIKTEFDLWDDSTNAGFPGVWWDHYKDELPAGRCDAIVELDFNTYKKQYEVRLVAVRSRQEEIIPLTASVDWILDWRQAAQTSMPAASASILPVPVCPASWDDLQAWMRRAAQTKQSLALAYPPPVIEPSPLIWQRLVGIAKYLSRTGETATRQQLRDKLEVGDRALKVGFAALKRLGFTITSTSEGFSFTWATSPPDLSEAEIQAAVAQFYQLVQEEQFRRRYFYEVPLAVIQSIAQTSL